MRRLQHCAWLHVGVCLLAWLQHGRLIGPVHCFTALWSNRRPFWTRRWSSSAPPTTFWTGHHHQYQPMNHFTWKLTTASQNWDDDWNPSYQTLGSKEAREVREQRTPPPQNRWIVLVDDEASIRDAVGQLLRDRGYQVTTCNDGAEALQLLQNGAARPPPSATSSTLVATSTTITASSSSSAALPVLPDAIVSDVRMPNMDGLQLLEAIRKDGDGRLVQLPVILLTAKGQTEHRIAGYQAGADAYIPKPFDPDEMVTLLDHVIARRQRLSGMNNVAMIDELKSEVAEIKTLLAQGGAGPGLYGYVDKAQQVFLAPDERNALELLCQGLTTKDMASRMYLSLRRVQAILSGMYRKANVKNRTELVRWAIASGQVQL